MADGAYRGVREGGNGAFRWAGAVGSSGFGRVGPMCRGSCWAGGSETLSGRGTCFKTDSTSFSCQDGIHQSFLPRSSPFRISSLVLDGETQPSIFLFTNKRGTTAGTKAGFSVVREGKIDWCRSWCSTHNQEHKLETHEPNLEPDENQELAWPCFDP